jgi:citrate lyase subunit beta / citryl-CoA lyase
VAEDLRPRRSALYIPGANARALEKAKAIPADALILDLEDAVAPDAKPEARERVCDAVASGGYGPRELIIRVNGLTTRWGGEDLQAIAQTGADAVLIPKIGTAGDIVEVERRLEAAGAPDSTRIWAMLETPSGILDVRSIATVSERLIVLVMGTNDITKELHAEHVPGRQPILLALSACLLAAREAGRVILDGVYNNIQNAEGFEAECLQGRQIGMDGKTLIHPSQVDPCNRVFAPSTEEVEAARQIIAAFQRAQSEGRGVVTVNGRMVENLHVENARRTLALADAIGAMDG